MKKAPVPSENESQETTERRHIQPLRTDLLQYFLELGVSSVYISGLSAALIGPPIYAEHHLLRIGPTAVCSCDHTHSHRDIFERNIK